MTYVAMRNLEDRETMTLGEAHPAIAKAQAAYDAFVAALREVQQVENQRADTTASEFLDCITSADRDWRDLVGDSAEAFREAGVRKVRDAA